MSLELEDESLINEAYSEIKKLSKELDKYELELLLDGEYDSNSAVLTVNSGAGGVDAQDFAQMLLRMYLRYAEAHNYKEVIAVLQCPRCSEIALTSNPYINNKSSAKAELLYIRCCTRDSDCKKGHFYK